MPVTPDVSVVLAVYDTLPYLPRCLTSLAEQTLGQAPLEVVAVDDGSTDGSGEEVDRFAAQHPGLVRVTHQANSGGPAAPSNRALEVATGRYVFFLGADDYLASDALERLVAYADQHGSDVVLGKAVGVNGRGMPLRLFARDQPVVDPFGPDLRWALANTNLYRRDLLEKHRIRYREDLPFGSDQPFMLEAVVAAGVVSVLGGDPCYYVVDREDRSNVSYATSYDDRVAAITALVETVARLIAPGPQRDTILVRHFTVEVPSLLRRDLPALAPERRAEVCAVVSDLARRYCSERVYAELRVEPRVLLRLAERGEAELVRAMVPPEEHGPWPVHATSSGAYVGYPGFDPQHPDPAYALPDSGGLRHRLLAGMALQQLRWQRPAWWRARLVAEVLLDLHDPDGAATVTARLARGPRDEHPLPANARVSREETGTRVRVVAPLRAALRAGTGPGPGTWEPRLQVAVGHLSVDLPVPPPESPTRTWVWHRAARHEVITEPAKHRPALLLRIGGE